MAEKTGHYFPEWVAVFFRNEWLYFPEYARGLTTGKWISEHHNLVIVGPTGVGKTFIACALATAACRIGFKAQYHRLSRLMQDIVIAKADGSYPRLFKQLSKVDMLILDDWGLAPM